MASPAGRVVYCFTTSWFTADLSVTKVPQPTLIAFQTSFFDVFYCYSFRSSGLSYFDLCSIVRHRTSLRVTYCFEGDVFLAKMLPRIWLFYQFSRHHRLRMTGVQLPLSNAMDYLFPYGIRWMQFLICVWSHSQSKY